MLVGTLGVGDIIGSQPLPDLHFTNTALPTHSHNYSVATQYLAATLQPEMTSSRAAVDQ